MVIVYPMTFKIYEVVLVLKSERLTSFCLLTRMSVVTGLENQKG